MPSAAHHRAVLGPLHLAERDQRRGRATAARAARAARSRAAMPSGSGSGWSRIADLLARARAARAAAPRGAGCRGGRELASTSSRISERRPVRRRHGWAGSSSRAMRSESSEHGRAGQRVGHRRDGGRARRSASSVTSAKSSPSFGSSLRDRLGGEAALERAEARGPRAGLVLARHPGELLLGSPEPIRAQRRASSAPSHRMKRRLKRNLAGRGATESRGGATKARILAIEARHPGEVTPRGVHVPVARPPSAPRRLRERTVAFAPL